MCVCCSQNYTFARWIYEVLLTTNQTYEQTPSQSAFSVVLWCPHNCIFEHPEGHNGPVPARNTNLSALASETMWSQPILIELLTVQLLLQTHMLFPSPTSSQFPLTTCLKSSWIHFDLTVRNTRDILRKWYEEVTFKRPLSPLTSKNWFNFTF
jgi:hypothetical protein